MRGHGNPRVMHGDNGGKSKPVEYADYPAIIGHGLSMTAIARNPGSCTRQAHSPSPPESSAPIRSGRAQSFQQLGPIQCLGVAAAARLVLEGAGGQPAFGYHHPLRDADQFDVGEHRARAQAAVVEHRI